MVTKKGCVALATAGVILSSCSGNQEPTKQDLGTIIGGAAGAIVGAQFGSGAGHVVGAGIGGVAGALIGSQVGKSMDKKDDTAAERRRQEAIQLEQRRRQATLNEQRRYNNQYGY